jgi:hypothetical protein
MEHSGAKAAMLLLHFMIAAVITPAALAVTAVACGVL